MFNIPTLVFSICDRGSRDFFAAEPDPHARAFYGLFTLSMVGIGVSFISAEVLWRKSYAGSLNLVRWIFVQIFFFFFKFTIFIIRKKKYGLGKIICF